MKSKRFSINLLKDSMMLSEKYFYSIYGERTGTFDDVSLLCRVRQRRRQRQTLTMRSSNASVARARMRTTTTSLVLSHCYSSQFCLSCSVILVLTPFPRRTENNSGVVMADLKARVQCRIRSDVGVTLVYGFSRTGCFQNRLESYNVSTISKI